MEIMDGVGTDRWEVGMATVLGVEIMQHPTIGVF